MAASFKPAFEATLRNEGGYGNDPQDPGGETYRGIARKFHSKWEGWSTIDNLKKKSNFPRSLDQDATLLAQIQDFYQHQFWDKIRGDEIENQDIAESIFDFAVNAGISASVTLAQTACGLEADGVMGKDTLTALNQQDPKTFLALFALHKIARYVHIVDKRPESRKFFFGWVKRTLEGV
jgi:lysozyme family protein